MWNALFQAIVAFVVLLATAAQIEPWALEQANREQGVHKQSWGRVIAWAMNFKAFESHNHSWTAEEWETRRGILERFSWSWLFLVSLAAVVVNAGVFTAKVIDSIG